MKIIPSAVNETTPDIAGTLLEAIQGIRYGSVEVIIHDRKIVQIERKEKLRLDLMLPQRR